MNKTQNKKVVEILEEMTMLRAKLDDLGNMLSEIADDVREKFDAKSERAQESETGQKLGEEADRLEEARDAANDGDLVSAIDALEMLP